MDTPLSESGAPFHLKFWGVRGSVPTTAPQNQGVGGNTACVQVVVPGDDIIILDGGTGIRALGKEILDREILERIQPPKAIHIFITHFHWDHIQGLPFFAPMFVHGSRVIFHSPHPPAHLEKVLAAQMHNPYFPLEFEQLEGSLEFREIGSEPQHFGDLTVCAFPLHHPQGSVGYRIEHPDKTAIYATDHEHGNAEADLLLRRYSANADMLIYDGQYLPSEYARRRGWGHSTWLEGTRAAADAGVGKLILFHHDPDRDDAAIAAIEDDARSVIPGVVIARESLVL